ncbi:MULTISPECIES: MAG1360 family OppF-related protein [unclassified Mycoplasma]|uniref:MAG1360 family OppF-related protein n=1 Tax=unclassified Mycoplasma TaxID=2683645 RepID=UPI00211D0C10|nr:MULTISPECIES: hypothetical protein [unclassified Mycoplasma]UUM20002.1 hypothetical protein NPA11_01005 [Mycoplasma sp. 1578d]UUM24983.1 hypothetical protein NPA12_00990 [Mycoplasma sp. 3686d]
MRKENLLLTIWNMFDYSTQNGKNRFLNIPRIDVYENIPAAFYIDSAYNNFSYSFFWENFIQKNNNTVSLWFEDAQNKGKQVILKKEEIKKYVSCFKLKNIIQEQDNHLPIYKIWKDCLKEHNTDQIAKTDLKKIFTLFEIPIKNAFYSILFQKSEFIINLNTELVRTMQFLENSIHTKGGVFSKDDLLGLIENFNKKIILIQNDLFNQYFEIFDELIAHLNIYSQSGILENGAHQQREIKEYKIQLNYLNNVSQSSIQKVHNDIKIRDTSFEIDFYKEYKNIVSSQGINQIQVIKKHWKNQLLTLKNHPKRSSSDTFAKTHLYRNYFYIKSVLKLWNMHQNKIKYASIEQIAQLDKAIMNERLFFNVVSKKNIYHASLLKKYFTYKIIEEDFHKIAQYIYQASENRQTQIQDKINNLQRKLSKLTKEHFEQSPLKRNVAKIKSLEEKIKLAEADLQWNNLSELKLYKSKLKTKNLKIKQLSVSVKKTLKTALSFFKHISDLIRLHRDKNDILIDDEYINFENFFTQYIDLEIFNDFIVLLSNFSLNKNKDTNKFVNYFLGVSKFVKSINYLSINSINLFYPFKELNFLEVAKLELVKYYLNQSKVIFIEDDPEIKNHNIKNEFFRVFKNIAYENDINYIFLSQDTKFLFENFEHIHIFYNNTAIEGGELKNVLSNPLHPLTQKILNKKATKNASLNNVLEDYIFNELITPDRNNYHYIYSKYGNYKKWKNSQIEVQKNFLNYNDQPLDLNLDKFVEINLSSFFQNTEFELTNITKLKPLMRKILPSDFKKTTPESSANENSF